MGVEPSRRGWISRNSVSVTISLVGFGIGAVACLVSFALGVNLAERNYTREMKEAERLQKDLEVYHATHGQYPDESFYRTDWDRIWADETGARFHSGLFGGHVFHVDYGKA